MWLKQRVLVAALAAAARLGNRRQRCRTILPSAGTAPGRNASTALDRCRLPAGPVFRVTALTRSEGHNSALSALRPSANRRLGRDRHPPASLK